jgi:AraC-like DNA-binding protein
MLLPLSILGLILSVILLYFNARRYKSSIFLGLFFFLLSLYGFVQYVLLYSKSVTLVSIVFTNVGFPTYLIGPVLYFYIRSVLTDKAKLKKHDLWHLLPMLAYLAGASAYILSPWTYKIEVAEKIVDANLMMAPFNLGLVPMYKHVPAVAVYLSRPLLVLGYLLWSVVLFMRYMLYGKGSTVLKQQHFMIKWLWTLLGFLFILVLSHALQIIHTFKVMDTAIFNTLNLLQFFSGVGLAGLLISPFFFPGILYGLPRVQGPRPVATSFDENTAVLPSFTQKNKISFEDDYLLMIEKKANACMEAHQPYLQSDCNLAYFAKIIAIPPHHLAYYFREIKMQPFNEFRNEYRVKHAKELIRQGKANEMTLEAIGFLSGFSTRKTFIATFKKVEGISPGVFHTQLND